MRLLLLFILAIVTLNAHAQKDAPDWLDPFQRQSKYPPESYLTGLSSELVGKKESLADAYGQLNQLSRNQIIESIRVEVKAETEMNISIVNTEATQLLDQRSVSASEAELVGLKFGNYYDKRKKLAFSFSYVSISELLKYHLNIISESILDTDKNIREANSELKASNKQKVIELIYTSQLELAKINKSALIVLSLGREDQLNLEKIRSLKKSVESLTDKVFTEGSLSVNNLATYLAYQLQLQLPEEQATVCTGAINYLNSGRESDFSIAVSDKSFNRLVELGTVRRAEDDCSCTLRGTYSKTNNTINVTGNLENKAKKAIAGITIKVSQDVLTLGELSFLPTNFEYINQLPAIKISSGQSEYTIKKVDLFDYPIVMEVKNEAELLLDIPLRFEVARDTELEVKKVIPTDKYGKSTLLLNTEELKLSGNFVLTTVIDVASLLNVPETSDFYQKTIQDYPPYKLENKITILAPTVFVNSTELSLGQERTIPILAPSIKKELATLDYKFVNSLEEADYLVEIKSATREGQNASLAHFSYLDATVSMQSLKTDKEIYKYSVSNVKGAGSNFSVADAKAYEKAKKLIANDLSYKLEFGDR